MTSAVLDASVVLKWFRRERERHDDRARTLRARFDDGQLSIVAPTLLRLEILNVAARRWRWDGHDLRRLVAALDDIGFDYRDPGIDAVAGWSAKGLTAYDASYVALAELEGVPLVTDDRLVLEVASPPAVALGSL